MGNSYRDLTRLVIETQNARVIPCPCGGGRPDRIADGSEVPQAVIHDDGTLTCSECGADIKAEDRED